MHVVNLPNKVGLSFFQTNDTDNFSKLMKERKKKCSNFLGWIKRNSWTLWVFWNNVCAQQTNELLPGGGFVALPAEQPFPGLWLFERHSLPGSLPVPHALYSTAGKRLQVSRIPGTNTTTTLNGSRTSPVTSHWDNRENTPGLRLKLNRPLSPYSPLLWPLCCVHIV